MELENNEANRKLIANKLTATLINLKEGTPIKIFMEKKNRAIKIDSVWGGEAQATIQDKDSKTSYSSGKVSFENTSNLLSDASVFLYTGVVNTECFKKIPFEKMD